MNYESRFTEKGGDVDLLSEEERSQRKRRRLIIIAGAVLLAAALIAWFAFGSGKQDGAATTGNGAGKTLPVVTVVVPGQQTVDRVISATGTLAARREMPIGVVGEGGSVTRVLVEPGDWVNAGQVLATVERSVQTQQSAQLAAQINVARADAKLAQAELDRAQTLVTRGFISKADIDRRVATRDAAVARVRVAEAQLAENRALISRLDIRAPEAGLVLTRDVEPGQVIGGSSGVLFRMARGGEMELRAQLNEADLVVVPVGSRATVTPVGTTQAFEGRVWQISPVVNQENRQGIARIQLAYNKAIRPGGFATTRIVAGSQQAPVLPESAVMSDEKGNQFVYVVGKDNKIARRAVTTGTVSADGIAIASGLGPNDKVVLRAGGFLNPGETVKPELQKK